MHFNWMKTRSAFFKEFSMGGRSRNCSEIWDVKFAAGVARPPECCELGKLGMCGKLSLKGAPGGGRIFLIIRQFEMRFSIFSVYFQKTKKLKTHFRET